MWQGTYIDKNWYFSVHSTSLNGTVKYSWNKICSLESPAFQAGSAVKKIIKKHIIEHSVNKRCGRDGWSSDAVCVHTVLLIDQNLLLFHITSAWNHKFIMFLPQTAFYVEDECNEAYSLTHLKNIAYFKKIVINRWDKSSEKWWIIWVNLILSNFEISVVNFTISSSK